MEVTGESSMKTVLCKTVDEPQKLLRKVPQNEMTERMLKEHCRQHDLYMTLALNDVLYLHHKGFSKIANLEPYTGLKSLWLENNCIKKIENLGHLTELRCLFMQNNMIECVENFEGLTNLSNLNLGSNYISSLGVILSQQLPNLHTLVLTRNKLKTAEDIYDLRQCNSLAILDLSYNSLDDFAGVVGVLSAMPELRVLTMTGNPVVRTTKNYRREMVDSCKLLTYLDQRPVDEKERLSVNAWRSGGLEGERLFREEWAKKEHDKMAEGIRRLMRIRDANLVKRGIDPDDAAAQLEAVQKHGEELLERYKRELLLKKDSELRDLSVLDPCQKSIQLCLENERLAIPDLCDDEDGMREKLASYAGRARGGTNHCSVQVSSSDLQGSNDILEQLESLSSGINADEVSPRSEEKEVSQEINDDFGISSKECNIVEPVIEIVNTVQLQQDEEIVETSKLDSLEATINHESEKNCPLELDDNSVGESLNEVGTEAIDQKTEMIPCQEEELRIIDLEETSHGEPEMATAMETQENTNKKTKKVTSEYLEVDESLNEKLALKSTKQLIGINSEMEKLFLATKRNKQQSETQNRSSSKQEAKNKSVLIEELD